MIERERVSLLGGACGDAEWRNCQQKIRIAGNSPSAVFPPTLLRTAAGPRPFLASGSPKKYHCLFFPSFGSACIITTSKGTSFNTARFANSDSTLYYFFLFHWRFRLVPFVRFSSGHRALNWGLGDLFLVPFAISRLQPVVSYPYF